MKTVLITGASSGIGAGLAKSFADDGYRVIACGRDAQRLAAVHQHSPNITVRLFDMTDRDACRRAGGLCCRHGDSLRRNLRVSRPRRGGCRAGGAGHDHQFHGAGKLPCGVAAATGIRQPRGAGQFDGALASLPASRSLWGL